MLCGTSKYRYLDEKPHKCDGCNRAYRWRRGLIQHKRYECGKEPQFSCGVCDYKSKTKGNLKQHIFKRHT